VIGIVHRHEVPRRHRHAFQYARADHDFVSVK
jgi:hypothetical protein